MSAPWPAAPPGVSHTTGAPAAATTATSWSGSMEPLSTGERFFANLGTVHDENQPDRPAIRLDVYEGWGIERADAIREVGGRIRVAIDHWAQCH